MSRRLLLSLALLGAGCTEVHTVPERDGAAGSDAPGHRDAGPLDARRPDRGCSTPAKVDLLFVIDDSAGTAEEHLRLREALPSFLSLLLEPPDRDGDGARDWHPTPDLHVGVVSSDMGAGGHPVPTCAGEFGDDGLLRTEGDTSLPGCTATYPPFLSARAGGSDPALVAADLRCVIPAHDGCGIEQPLEAALKAVTPSTSDLTFFRGTGGHADGANAGFLRDDSFFAVVVLTDENDCSVRDPELFDPASTRYDASVDLRCFTYPEALQPAARYADGLLALRPAAPEMLMYAIIAGVPPDLGGSSFDGILGDPRMQERIDPASPGSLVPVCRAEDATAAHPARRLVEVGRELGRRGALGYVHTVCETDYGEALRRLAERIGRNACEVFLD